MSNTCCFVCLMTGAKTCEGSCGLCGSRCPGSDAQISLRNHWQQARRVMYETYQEPSQSAELAESDAEDEK